MAGAGGNLSHQEKSCFFPLYQVLSAGGEQLAAKVDEERMVGEWKDGYGREAGSPKHLVGGPISNRHSLPYRLEVGLAGGGGETPQVEEGLQPFLVAAGFFII